MEAAGAANVDALFPLSPTQEGILYHTLLAEQAGMYVMQFTCDLEGDLEIDTFKKAWDAVISRHQMLRALVLWEGRKTPLQLIRKQVDVPWWVEDLAYLGEKNRQRHLSGYLARDANTPFTLDKAPLMRFALFRISDRSAKFVWTHHYLILDGWSANIALEQVLRDYELIRSGEQADTDPSHAFQGLVSYTREKDRSDARSHWRRYLDGFKEPNRIETTGVSGNPRWSTSQDRVDGEMSAESSHRLVEFAKKHELTLDTIFRAAWAFVVSRYSGERRVVFGGVVSGRPPDLEGSLSTVGPFINTLPVHIEVDPEQNVLDWLAGLKADRIQAAEHEWAPLPEIQEWCELPAGRPLFTSVLVTENQPGASQPGHLKLANVEYWQPTNYPLTLFNFPVDRLHFAILHDREVVDDISARRLMDEYLNVVESMVLSPDSTLGDIEVFTDADLMEIGELMEGERLDPPFDTVIEAISEAAARHPRAVAVIGESEELSYKTLLERASDLRALLSESGLEPGGVVAIAMERCPGMIVAIVGVLLAGGAYAPIDPETHPARVKSQLDSLDCDLAVVLADGRGQLIHQAKEIAINRDGTPAGDRPLGSLPSEIPMDPDSSAYVMFTSGSTGEPKGVVVSHRALARSTGARFQAYRRQPTSFLLLSPFFFDSSVAGIFWALTSGASLVLPGPAMEQDIGHVQQLIARHQVTHLLALPSVYELLLQTSEPESLASLKTAIVAGEPCPPELVDHHCSILAGADLVNEYGPTEGTVWATFHYTTRDDSRRARVPIGRPIPGTFAVILDRDRRPVPVGVSGELAIGGAALTDGYANQPGLTSEKFMDVSLPHHRALRVYLTGDRARFTADGEIDLIGRIDRQVKVRGRRIEPEGIEAVVMTHREVRTAVVEMITAPSGSSDLAAFYVPTAGAEVSPEALRGHLLDLLPPYMVPRHLVPLKALPLNQNGKVERSRLVLPKESELENGPTRPLTDSERLVVGIARDLIGHSAIGPDDNFFESGGHSLLSMQLIARIFTETGARVPPNLVLFNSLAYIAISVDEQLGRNTPSQPLATTVSRDSRVVWFGPHDTLFGILDTPPPPASVPHERVVVFCPPYGWEYYKTHLALRRLARSVSESHPVFRFDYRGTGDSADPSEVAGMDEWVEDARAAVTEAQRLTGAEKVSILGLRLGAGIATLAAESDVCDHLVLWDPVLDGTRHLRSLELMHHELMKTNGSRVARRQSGIELLGSPYPPALRSDLLSLHLSASDLPNEVRVNVVVSDRRNEYDSLTEDQRLSISLEVVDDAGGWDDLGTFHSALLPGPIARHLWSLLTGTA